MAFEVSRFGITEKDLPLGWKVERLDRLADLNPEQIGADYPHSEIAYLDIANVSAGVIGEPARLSLASAPSRAKRIVRPSDIIVSTVRPGNRAYAFLRNVPTNLIVSTGFAVLRSKPHLADPRFVYYVATSEPVIDYLASIAEEKSAYPSVNPIDIAECVVPTPPLPEQRAIAHILGTLDDKIELNRRMNETLEAMARELFNSWFVDFGPVRAKAEGRDPGLPKAIADVFPDCFQDSELGRIPKGWRVGKLGDVLTTIETGGRPKGGVKDIAAGVPSVGAESIVGLGHFDYGKTKFVPREFFQAMTKGHVRDADVLLYKDGGRPGEFEPHVTMVGDGFPFDRFCINEHVYRLRTEPGVPQEYLYFWLSSDGAVDEMRNRGTGVAVPGLNSTAVRQLAVLLPGEPALTRFQREVGKLVRRVFATCNQSRTLAALRETLLPKLISGELRVTHAERISAAAL